MGVQKLQWSIDGGFITDLAREWFWLEQQPYEKVMELLMLCMKGTSQTKVELTKLAHELLMGKCKFIGNTGDGSYAMVSDNTDITDKYRGFNPDVIQDKMIALVQNGLDNQLYLKMMDNIRKQKRDRYGWLRPDGKFFEVPFGSHQVWAFDYIAERCDEDSATRVDVSDYWKRRKTDVPSADDMKMGDYLEYKGWVLLHSTQRLEAMITSSPIRPYTKVQKEFLFDYFTKQGRHTESYNVLN